MSKRTAKEIVKVNRIVNLISCILMGITVIGWILIIGFVESLFVPGMLVGTAMALLPLIWFHWLDKLGWNDIKTEARIKIAKKKVKRIKGNFNYIDTTFPVCYNKKGV